jgi:hypothetical protein
MIDHDALLQVSTVSHFHFHLVSSTVLTTPPFFLTLIVNPRHHDLTHCVISLRRSIYQPSPRKSRVASQHTSALPRQFSITLATAGSIDFLGISTALVPIQYFVGCQRNSPPCHIGVEERVLKRRGARSTITVHPKFQGPYVPMTWSSESHPLRRSYNISCTTFPYYAIISSEHRLSL